MTESRDPNFKNVVPGGVCQACGMAKISRAGASICPNCDSKTGTRSGLRSTVEDPGDAMTADGNIGAGVKVRGGIVKEDGQVVIGHAGVVASSRQQLAPVLEDPITTSCNCLEQASTALDELKLSDFKDLRSARKVMTLKKKIATLKIDIESLGG